MIEFHEDAVADLKALDASVRRRVVKYIDRQISTLDDPRTRGGPLSGEMAGLWRYRVGDVRVVGVVGEGDPPALLVIGVKYRREIYGARSRRKLTSLLEDAMRRGGP